MQTHDLAIPSDMGRLYDVVLAIRGLLYWSYQLLVCQPLISILGNSAGGHFAYDLLLALATTYRMAPGESRFTDTWRPADCRWPTFHVHHHVTVAGHMNPMGWHRCFLGLFFHAQITAGLAQEWCGWGPCRQRKRRASARHRSRCTKRIPPIHGTRRRRPGSSYGWHKRPGCGSEKGRIGNARRSRERRRNSRFGGVGKGRFHFPDWIRCHRGGCGGEVKIHGPAYDGHGGSSGRTCHIPGRGGH